MSSAASGAPLSAHQAASMRKSGSGAVGAGGGTAGSPRKSAANAKIGAAQQAALQAQQQQQQQMATLSKEAAVTLNFPVSISDAASAGGSAGGGGAFSGGSSTSLFQPFKDDSSAYPLVAKNCLQLTQFAGYGSSTTTEDSTSTASSALFHDATWTAHISQAFAALIECLSSHKDRRCRILAAKTLAILGRSAYARTRPSPLIYPQRESGNHRLEDEVGTEIPQALASAVLDDPDNGVSASSMEAIGIMTLVNNSSATGGNAACSATEDELLREMLSITCARPTLYAPSLRQLVDEDLSIPQMELSARIYENILAPRLLQILDRISLYKSQALLAMALPTLTACLIHQVKAAPGLAFSMDRATYAKRWIDVNMAAIVDLVVHNLLLPALESTTHGTLFYASALSVVRLAHVCPHASWATTACLLAAKAFREQLNQQSLDVESKCATLAALVIAARMIPLPDGRLKFLNFVAAQLAAYPSTTMAPCGVVSPGVLVEWQNCKTYRRPARIGLWTEIALSLFVDGVVVVTNSNNNNGNSTYGAASPPPGGALSAEQKELQKCAGRNQALLGFFASPTIAKILQDKVVRSAGVPAALLNLYDELLLVFSTVAVDTGRRLRVTPDGTLLLADPESPEVTEWILLAWTVLTTFTSCVDMTPPPSPSKQQQQAENATPPSGSSMDEEWSVLAAGQAAYVRLVQEYMYMVGLLNPDTSVALKLTPNALPPQLLWDQMSESASFLSKFFEAVDLNKHEQTSILMEEIVAREMKHGIPSHHMRMFLLSLAADNWVQGRILSARKHFEALASGSTTAAMIAPSSLRHQSACDIVLALSPKRLVAKLFEGQQQQNKDAGKEGEENNKSSSKKRDPLKKLAQETVRVSVACIETIALTACEWRRRFGSGPELKQIVSITVGMLQGKIDETPVDEAIQVAVMGPVCEAAVARIQAFYEKDPGEHTFPASDLVTQPVKPKIKPLISPSKPARSSMDKVLSGHVMQLCRQMIRSRIEQCVASAPPADSLLTCARPSNWLRLTLPPLPESKDARLLGNYFHDPLSQWGASVALSSASSDAATLVAAYTPRRYFRYDGEDEFRLTVILRATNITAVEFPEGLRLELHVLTKLPDPIELRDPVSLEILDQLGMDLEKEGMNKSLTSSMVAFRHEFKPADSVTWEVSLNPLTLSANSVLLPSVVFRNVKVETAEEGAKWVGEKTSTSGDASTATGGTSGSGGKTGEDDFQVTSTDRGGTAGGDDSNVLTEHVTLTGEPLHLSPMVGLQPCPLVFYRNSMGDVSTFRFFWFNLPHHIPSMKVVQSSASRGGGGGDSHHTISSPMDKKLAEMSALQWGGEAIPGGYATKTWAFCDWKGQRLFCVLAETDTGSTALHFRGDQQVLYTIAGTKRARESVVASLLPGMVLSE